MDDSALHILVLADRDWTHPQGGGSGANLHAHVTRWIDWGHRVTVIACSYEGAVACEREGDLTIHRIGGRSTVFPRAIWRCWRGLVPDADVALEVFNGISFLTPLWLRTPRVTMIHHVHRDHYVAEMGRKGRIAALALETAPLRSVYRRSRFVTMSKASAAGIASHGIAREHIRINNPGVECAGLEPGEESVEPTLLFLGRIKRYKRPELILDILEAIPGTSLDIAGDGDYRESLEQQIEARGLSDRVRVHGFVDDETKRRLLQRAWVHVMPSSNEGWALTVVEAAACGTPTVASNNGGLRESVVHEHTGLLADDGPGLVAATRRLIEDPTLRRRMADNGLARVENLSWDRHARTTLDELHAARDLAHAAAAPPSFVRRGATTALVSANVLALLAAALVSTGLIVGLAGGELLLGAAFGVALLRRPTAAPGSTVPDTPA